MKPPTRPHPHKIAARTAALAWTAVNPDPRPRHRPYRFAARTVTLAWVSASVQTAVVCAVVVMYESLRYHQVPSGAWTVMALAVISLRFASFRWDKITDTDVLHRLRLAEGPCGADDLARGLGRRHGPVHLSLLRLFRGGFVAPTYSVDGVVRYISL
ncbi:hypothetical protein ACWC5I_08850 [Kitasatospora sp. NPDC001574]